MINMTDIRGVLRDPQDESSLISVVRAGEAPALMREGVISGGMIPKVECCIEAIRRGVKKVFIIDGRVKHAILIECLTDEGVGTMFTQGVTFALETGLSSHESDIKEPDEPIHCPHLRAV